MGQCYTDRVSVTLRLDKTPSLFEADCRILVLRRLAAPGRAHSAIQCALDLVLEPIAAQWPSAIGCMRISADSSWLMRCRVIPVARAVLLKRACLREL